MKLHAWLLAVQPMCLLWINHKIIHFFLLEKWLTAYTMLHHLQGSWGSPCLFHGISAFKNNYCLHDLPVGLPLDMLRHYVDTNSRDPVPAAILPYDSYQAACPPKVFWAKWPSGIGRSWVWRAWRCPPRSHAGIHLSPILGQWWLCFTLQFSDAPSLLLIWIFCSTQEDGASDSGSCGSRDDAEIFDELTTNRGELKHRTSSHREERHLQVIKLFANEQYCSECA